MMDWLDVETHECVSCGEEAAFTLGGECLQKCSDATLNSDLREVESKMRDMAYDELQSGNNGKFDSIIKCVEMLRGVMDE